jgi:hypothetical protein
MIIKPTANLIAVTTASSVANSTLVRIHTTTATTVTINTSAGAYVGSFSMPANFVEIVEKAATDTITCSASSNCTPVAYKA